VGMYGGTLMGSDGGKGGEGGAPPSSSALHGRALHRQTGMHTRACKDTTRRVRYLHLLYGHAP
jgi:hypothetical protein